MRVLDLACGEGRHALAAAALGAQVIGLDNDSEKLAAARDAAARLSLRAEFRCVDLEGPWPPLGAFDAILDFNYLDRARMPQLVECIAPGGVLFMETYLVAQREQGWGPTSADHLVHPGELARLVDPLEVLHGREVMEPVDAERWRAVASVIARRPE
ncbi:MAG TPA: class I SAM-dependent methyltransferase [Gemmatimonadales bacterium]|nr:class I SAM-dependent methyltransferase [Gemmatimonadales bacterium]